MEDVGETDEGENKERAGVGGDEKEGQPTEEDITVSNQYNSPELLLSFFLFFFLLPSWWFASGSIWIPSEAEHFQ